MGMGKRPGMLGVDRRRSGFPEIVRSGTMAVMVTLWDRQEGIGCISYAGLIYPSVVWDLI